MADPVPADNKVATKKSKRQRRKKKKQRKKKANVGPTPAVPNDRKQTIALEYLHLWTVDKEAWSFKKKPQYWLLSNMYNKAQVRISTYIHMAIHVCYNIRVCCSNLLVGYFTFNRAF